jgi:hypothetical protein
MFGYVKPDNPNMYVKDVVLYKSLYCGLCKSIGKYCGEKARLVLNYDLAFLSGFLHNITNTDVVIKKQRCVIHWFIRRPVTVPDKLSQKIGALNVILAYEKLTDDVLDSNKGKLKRSFFNSSYKKIKKKEQTLCRLVSDGYRKIYEYEKQDGSSVNVISELFGELLQDLVVYLAGDYADDNVKNLAFNLGKWIYVIDALDDFDKDVKKGEYNPFKKEFPLINTKKQLLTEKREYLEYTFGDILSEIEYSHKKIKYYFNHDFIDNVLQKGLLVETKKIMEK